MTKTMWCIVDRDGAPVPGVFEDTKDGAWWVFVQDAGDLCELDEAVDARLRAQGYRAVPVRVEVEE